MEIIRPEPRRVGNMILEKQETTTTTTIKNEKDICHNYEIANSQAHLNSNGNNNNNNNNNNNTNNERNQMYLPSSHINISNVNGRKRVFGGSAPSLSTCKLFSQFKNDIQTKFINDKNDTCLSTSINTCNSITCLDQNCEQEKNSLINKQHLSKQQQQQQQQLHHQQIVQNRSTSVLNTCIIDNSSTQNTQPQSSRSTPTMYQNLLSKFNQQYHQHQQQQQQQQKQQQQQQVKRTHAMTPCPYKEPRHLSQNNRSVSVTPFTANTPQIQYLFFNEIDSLSKSSSDGYDVINKRKLSGKIKSKRKLQQQQQQTNNNQIYNSDTHYYHTPLTVNEAYQRPFYGGWSSDDNRSSGHATMSDAHSSYISSSPTDEENLQAIIEEETRQYSTENGLNNSTNENSTHLNNSNFIKNEITNKHISKKNGHYRRRAGDHHLRRVHTNDNLLATLMSEDGQGKTDVQQIVQAMEKLKMRAMTNGYSTTTSTYSSSTSMKSDGHCLQRLIRHSSLETIATNITQADEFIWLDNQARLVELQHLPWSNQDILQVLQQGRLKNLVDRISMEVILRLSFLLQRPLVRLAREAQRFSHFNCLCSKNEIISAIKLIFSQGLSDTCIKSGHRATAIYAVNGDNFKQSKSNQAGLQLSIGKFHRWMIDVNLGAFINNLAPIYLTAAIETLLEEIIFLCFSFKNEPLITVQVLDNCITNSADFWPIFQTSAHLSTARLLNNTLAMKLLNNDETLASSKSTAATTSGSTIGSTTTSAAGYSSIIQANINENDCHRSSPSTKYLEQNLLITCVTSLQELSDLINQIDQYNNLINVTSNSSNNLRTNNVHSNCLIWDQNALNTLFYFVKFGAFDQKDATTNSTTNNKATTNILNNGSNDLVYERPFSLLPPIAEWVRVANVHAEYRKSGIIDKDDVMQSARILLPGIDYPYRQIINCKESMFSRRECSKNDFSRLSKIDLAFRMLLSGRTDLVSTALTFLPTNTGINTMNEYGLTPLMLACIAGDEVMVEIIINSGADIDAETLSAPNKLCPYVCPDMQHWTGLTFATINQHFNIVKLLLEKGANVEGGASLNEEKTTETPLQLAAASGNIDLVKLLLSYGAHPFLSTMSTDNLALTSKGCCSAIAVAAIHGQRAVLRTLLAHPLAMVNKDVLSLEEILAEGQSTIRSVNRIEVVPVNQANACITIITEDGNKVIQLTKHQLRALQEALYHSVENGYLEISLDLRNFGVPWTLYCWMQTLSTAHEMRLDAITDQLLQDFLHVCSDDCSSQFVDECLPLLFNIFRHSKHNEGTSLLLADIFSTCYGKEEIQPINLRCLGTGGTRIDTKYVNNPEMSDVMFEVEGKIIYAHKIILVNASEKFADLFLNKPTNGSQPIIHQIKDIHYDIFMLMIKFLYNGGFEDDEVEDKDIFELLAAASYFQLNSLLNYCEYCCSSFLHLENVVSIYIHANVYKAISLQEYCQGFILQNLVGLLTYDESVRKLIFAKSLRDPDVLSGLLFTLQARVRERSFSNNIMSQSQSALHLGNQQLF